MKAMALWPIVKQASAVKQRAIAFGGAACAASLAAMIFFYDAAPCSARPTRASVRGEEIWYYAPPAATLQPLPLVLSYHGANSDGRQEISRWQPLAAKYGFVVVCPTSRLAGAGMASGSSRVAEAGEFEAEATRASDMLAHLASRFLIDRQRVMVTGFSGGGNVAYWLAFTQPRIFPYFCCRSANFPRRLQLYAASPTGRAEVEYAAAHSRGYIFWGKGDHPIILAEMPAIQAWLAAWRPRAWFVKCHGSGHRSRPEEAAAWFMAAVGNSDR